MNDTEQKCILVPPLNSTFEIEISKKRTEAARWIKPIGKVEIAKSIVTNESSIDNLPGFELRNLLTMLENNQALATRLMFNFKENMKNVPNEIETFMIAKNVVAANELIHKVKGSSGNIGAMKLYATAERLEVEFSVAAFEIFKREFDQTILVISALSETEHSVIEKTDGNSDALKETITELERLLDKNYFIGEALLNTLKSHLASSQLDWFIEFRKRIDSLNYEQARKVLWQLESVNSQENND